MAQERAMIDANSPIGMLVPGGALNKDRLEHFFGPNIDEKQRERFFQKKVIWSIDEAEGKSFHENFALVFGPYLYLISEASLKFIKAINHSEGPSLH
jgi:hypothetical protein